MKRRKKGETEMRNHKTIAERNLFKKKNVFEKCSTINDDCTADPTLDRIVFGKLRALHFSDCIKTHKTLLQENALLGTHDTHVIMNIQQKRQITPKSDTETDTNCDPMHDDNDAFDMPLLNNDTNEHEL